MSFSTIYPISFVCLVFFPVMFTAPTDLRLGLGKLVCIFLHKILYNVNFYKLFLLFVDTGRIQLNYIGTIEGKSFFTEQNVSLVKYIDKKSTNLVF